MTQALPVRTGQIPLLTALEERHHIGYGVVITQSPYPVLPEPHQ
jgi:hypothetical protein